MFTTFLFQIQILPLGLLCQSYRKRSESNQKSLQFELSWQVWSLSLSQSLSLSVSLSLSFAYGTHQINSYIFLFLFFFTVFFSLLSPSLSLLHVRLCKYPKIINTYKIYIYEYICIIIYYNIYFITLKCFVRFANTIKQKQIKTNPKITTRYTRSTDLILCSCIHTTHIRYIIHYVNPLYMLYLCLRKYAMWICLSIQYMIWYIPQPQLQLQLQLPTPTTNQLQQQQLPQQQQQILMQQQLQPTTTTNNNNSNKLENNMIPCVVFYICTGVSQLPRYYQIWVSSFSPGYVYLSILFFYIHLCICYYFLWFPI